VAGLRELALGAYFWLRRWRLWSPLSNKTHQILILNLATIDGFHVALWFSLPTRQVIQAEPDSAAQTQEAGAKYVAC
jgi:hypothetical protein